MPSNQDKLDEGSTDKPHTVSSDGLNEENPSQPTMSSAEALEHLPPSQREPVEQFMGTAMSMSMGMSHPIASKVTPEHITDIIASSNREIDHEYSDRRHSRITLVLFGGFLIVALVIRIISLAFLGMKDLLIEIFKYLGPFIGGLGGGYGFYAFRNR